MKKINYLEPAKSRRSNLKRLTWGNIYVLQNQTIKFCRKLYHAAKQLLASRPKQIFGGFSNQQTIILATAAHIHQTPMLIVVYALALTHTRLPIYHTKNNKNPPPPQTTKPIMYFGNNLKENCCIRVGMLRTNINWDCLLKLGFSIENLIQNH